MKKYLIAFFRDYVLVMIIASVIAFFLYGYLAIDRFFLPAASAAAGLFIFLYFLFIRRVASLTDASLKVNVAMLLLSLITHSLGMIVSGGFLQSEAFLPWYIVTAPFSLLNLITFLGSLGSFRLLTFILQIIAIIVLLVLLKKRIKAAPVMILVLITALLAGGNIYSYTHNDERKYSGHGFDYMHGFSSTDFTGYYVYSEPSKLVTLDHPASLLIEDEKDMPILDGAEACYPLYSAVAKAIYKDIDRIEKDFIDKPDGDKSLYINGKIVTFTNTVYGYWRLADKECDMLFGARPSQDQIDYAKDAGVEFQLTAIGREGFIFFVEEDNPVDNLTAEQIRAIYHGDITNWNQVGGKNQPIVAFQRPEGSGSQTMMLYFMGDVSLKEPKTYETFDAMSGIIEHVAQYNNEAGAMGYTFRYFLEGLQQEQHVKILSVDGIAPTVENIRTGKYPLITTLYCVTRANEDNPNVQKVLDFLLSEDGQYLVEQTGYAPLNK